MVRDFQEWNCGSPLNLFREKGDTLAINRNACRKARHQNRTVFEISSVMAMSAIADVPQKAHWVSASARLAMGRTGSVVSEPAEQRPT